MYGAIERVLLDFKKRIKSLENSLNFRKLIFPSDGTLVVPVSSSDPASPVNGQVWYNSTAHKYKGRENGVTVTFTTT